MQSLLRRIVPGLRGRRVHARLMIEPPKPVGEGWLIRLRCQNPGPPGQFDAEIVAVEAARPPGSDPAQSLPFESGPFESGPFESGPFESGLPWKLLWRGQSASRPVRLQTRGGELLRLAIFHPAEPATFVLLVGSPDATTEVRRPVDGANGIVVTVRVRRGNRVDAEKRIHLSSRQGDGRPFVPIVTDGTGA
jgi:hypothetical protein